MNLIFMGTPDFSVKALTALAQYHTILGVFTQPPRPAGHGLKMQKSPVHITAEQLGIPVFTPTTLKKGDGLADFLTMAQHADVAVVCAYGLILPDAVLKMPRLGCINIHASLLPRWRGAAPIQRAILAGDTQSGVTIMQMDTGLDTGDMLLKQEVPITPTTTAEQLHDALSDIGANLIINALKCLPIPQKQPTEGVTYAEKIQKEEAFLDFQKTSADDINRQVRAFNPFPGAYFFLNGERIKVFETEVVETHAAPAGTVLDDALLIQCNAQAIRLTVLQRAGKKPLPATEVLRGFHIPVGTIIER